jgi:hypothetical protein
VADEEETPEIRTFPPDTRMGDLPDDLTAEESLALFGSEYDESTAKLKSIVEMLMGPEAFHMIAAHKVREVSEPIFRIEQDDRLFEVVPKGLLIDVITIGLLAHEILKRVTPADGAMPSGISVQAFSLSDLLNGQGPFPVDPKNRDDDDS